MDDPSAFELPPIPPSPEEAAAEIVYPKPSPVTEAGLAQPPNPIEQVPPDPNQVQPLPNLTDGAEFSLRAGPNVSSNPIPMEPTPDMLPPPQQMDPVWNTLPPAQDDGAGYEDQAGPAQPDMSDLQPFERVFLARINGVYSGMYTWTEYTNVGGTLAAYTDGRQCTDAADPSAAVDPNGAAHAVGEIVTLLEILDNDDYRYEIIGGGGNTVVTVQVIDNGPGGAWGDCIYRGKVYRPFDVDAFDPTTNATEATLGDLPDTYDAIIINTVEIGVTNTGHDLTDAANTFGLNYIGRLVGTKTLYDVFYYIVEITAEYTACEQTGPVP